MPNDEVERVVQAITAAPGGSVDEAALVRLLNSRTHEYQVKFFEQLRANRDVIRHHRWGRYRWSPRKPWERWSR
jgi:hypothetical protein